MPIPEFVPIYRAAMAHHWRERLRLARHMREHAPLVSSEKRVQAGIAMIWERAIVEAIEELARYVAGELTEADYAVMDAPGYTSEGLSMRERVCAYMAAREAA